MFTLLKDGEQFPPLVQVCQLAEWAFLSLTCEPETAHGNKEEGVERNSFHKAVPPRKCGKTDQRRAEERAEMKRNTSGDESDYHHRQDAVLAAPEAQLLPAGDSRDRRICHRSPKNLVEGWCEEVLKQQVVAKDQARDVKVRLLTRSTDLADYRLTSVLTN